MRQQVVASAALLAAFASNTVLPAAAGPTSARQIASARSSVPMRPAGTNVTVPGGTPLSVNFIEPVSSSSAKVGDAIALKAAKTSPSTAGSSSRKTRSAKPR